MRHARSTVVWGAAAGKTLMWTQGRSARMRQGLSTRDEDIAMWGLSGQKSAC